MNHVKEVVNIHRRKIVFRQEKIVSLYEMLVISENCIEVNHDFITEHELKLLNIVLTFLNLLLKNAKK